LAAFTQVLEFSRKKERLLENIDNASKWVNGGWMGALDIHSNTKTMLIVTLTDRT